MEKGIYILANDHPQVLPDAIALLNSVKQHSPTTPVLMIPYDENYRKTLRVLHDMFGVELYDNRPVFEELDKRARAILGRNAPMLRKVAAWFGPFERFVYIDTDIVVFRDQEDVFDLLDEYDIVYCGSGAELGISHVFNERVLERALFSKEEIEGLFNAGFFASKKSALTYSQLISTLEDAAKVSDIFIPEHQDQPLINYLALRALPRRANIRDLAPEPGRSKSNLPGAGRVTCDAWAGDRTLKFDNGSAKFGDGSSVRHIHWAGFKSTPNKPYLDIWLRYRYPNVAQRMLASAYLGVQRVSGYIRR